jgi:hypothetical protein
MTRRRAKQRYRIFERAMFAEKTEANAASTRMRGHGYGTSVP